MDDAKFVIAAGYIIYLALQRVRSLECGGRAALAEIDIKVFRPHRDLRCQGVPTPAAQPHLMSELLPSQNLLVMPPEKTDDSSLLVSTLP